MSTFRLDALQSVLNGAPGAITDAPVVVHNDTQRDATFAIAVVGLQPVSSAPSATFEVRVPARSSIACQIPVEVPSTLGIGRHAAAFEVTSARAEDRPILQPFTVAIASVHEVVLTADPSTVRARRRGRLFIDIVNNEPNPVALTLDGAAPDVSIRFPNDVISLQPGQVARARGRVRGPVHWVGEPTQHNMLVTASGPASAVSINVPFVQRPLFAYRLRMLTAAVAVIALFCGAAFGALTWWNGRTNEPQLAGTLAERDADGDGFLDPALDANGNPIAGTGGLPVGAGSGIDADGDGLLDPLLDANGNPIAGTGGLPVGAGSGIDADGDGLLDPLLDANGNPIAGTGGLPVGAGSGIDADGDGFLDPALDANGNPIAGTGGLPVGAGDEQPTAAAGPSTTVIRGTVTAQGTSDIDGIRIQLAPIALGQAPPPGATAFAPAATEANAAGPKKIWSARYAVAPRALNSVRQTEPLRPRDAQIEANGVWLFTDVALRQSYEVVFSKAGFDTQTFVLTPPDDGAPIELDVELVPAVGRISGTVTADERGLGGVTIQISDGTLVFDTTSSTETDVGAWDLSGLSTPGVYTLIASRRGYGTVVQQVRLGPGDEKTDEVIQMTRNVGSVSGRATDPQGNPLPGVTISATDGEIVRETTTLTEGDLGFYNLPQLVSSDTYTVTASLDGYVTQTRRLEVQGNLTNVDFPMIPEKATLSGLITDPNGNGIVNAGVTLTKGDLKFKAATGAAPNAGAFAVDDLPPGEYVITIEHFKHVTVTEFRTIVAGQTPEPLNLQLEARDAVDGIGTATLTVRVVDPQAELQEDREVIGATITLTGSSAVAPGQPRFERSYVTTNFSYVIPDPLVLGTYTLVVSHPRYNTSAPRQVSIGLDGAAETVTLFPKGDATGTVVDALNNTIVLTPREVQLQQVSTNGEVGPPVPALIRGAGTAEARWESQPESLVLGTWRASVTDAGSPDGYTSRDSQDFEVTPDQLDPIVVDPIELVPYPNLAGRVLQPTLVGGAIQFVAIDEPSLAVTVSCTQGTEGTVNIGVDRGTITDTFGLTGGTLLDTFFIDKADVDGAELLGTCTFTASADGYETQTAVINDVAISDGVVNTDRFVNIAMSKNVGTFGGSLFWTDRGAADPNDARVFLPGVPITATQAVVDFGATDNPTSPGVDPTVIPLDISTTTSGQPAMGLWAFESLPTFNDQVFGEATYTFAAPGFGESTVALTIDENGQRITGGTGTNVDQSGGLAALAVELTAPGTTTISGNVRIISSDLARDYSIVQPTAVSPTGNPFTLVGPTATDPTLSITGADAGTWTIDFPAVPNHEYRRPTDVAAPATSTFFQTGRAEPGIARGGFDATLVELATAEFTIENDGVAVSSGTTITALDENGADLVTATFGPVPPAVRPVPNQYLITGIPVDSGPTPDITAVQRGFRVTIPDYDPNSASITVRGGNGQIVPSTVADPPTSIVIETGTNATSFIAGTAASYTISVDRFGTISGSVDAERAPGTREDLGLPVGGRPVIDAVRRLDLLGNPVPQVPASDPTAPTITVNGDGSDGTFTISGPPGFYEISFDDPAFENTPVSSPTADPVPVPAAAFGLYRIENDVNRPLDNPFVLTIVKGSLDITAVTQLGGGQPVTGAWYTLTSPAGQVIEGEVSTLIGGVATNNVIVDGLFPVSYQLQVRSYDDPVNRLGENAFPTIVDVMIDSRAGAPPPGPNTVIAPLPPLAASLSGAVVFQNEDGDRLLVPTLPTPFSVTADFAEPQVLVDDVLEDNTPLPTATGPVTLDAAAATPATYRYQFLDVPFGLHTLTAPPPPAGYNAAIIASPNPVTVSNIGPNIGPTITFEVPDTSVVVQLRPGDPELYDPTAATATLTSPTNDVYPMANFDAPTGTIRFDNVAPEDGFFTLDYDDTLHAPGTKADILVPAGAVAVPEFTTTADQGRVTGAVFQRSGPGANDVQAFVPENNQSVLLTPVGGGAATELIIGDGTFDQAVSPGNYNLTVTKTGYESSGLVPVTVTAGRLRSVLDITVNKLSEVTVTLDGATDVANGALTLSDAAASFSRDVTSTTDVFTTDLPAGNYVLTFTGDSYPSVLVENLVIDVGVNGTVAEVLPRQLSVSVTSPTQATVRVQLPAPNDPSKTVNSGSTVVFRSDEIGSAIPRTDSFDILVTAPSAGDVTRAIPAYVEGTLTLGQTAQVTLRGNPIIDVSGTITFPGGAAITNAPTDMVLTATPNPARGLSTITATPNATASGVTYNLQGLTTRANGGDQNWDITLTQDGVGVVDDSITVTSASINETGRALVATPRNVDVTFPLLSNDGSSLAGSIVTVDGSYASTALTGAETDAVVSVPENYVGSTNDVSVAGSPLHVGATATLSAFPWTTDEATITLISFDSQIISGTVTFIGTKVDGIDIRLCGDNTIACPGPVTQVGADNGDVVAFGTKPAGTYRLEASGTVEGADPATDPPIAINYVGSVTIDADGVPSVANIDIALK